MRNPQEYKPRIEIRGDNLTLTAYDYSKLRRVKEMLEQNDFNVIITGITIDNNVLRVAV